MLTKKEKRMLKLLYKWSRLEIDTFYVAKCLNICIYNKYHLDKILAESDISNKCYKEFAKINYDISELKKRRAWELTKTKSSTFLQSPNLSKLEMLKLLKRWSIGEITNRELCTEMKLGSATIRYCYKVRVVVERYYPELKSIFEYLVNQHKLIRLRETHAQPININSSITQLKRAWTEFESTKYDRFKFFDEIKLCVDGKILADEIKYRTVRYTIIGILSDKLELPYDVVKSTFSSNAYKIRGRSPMYGKSSHEDKIYKILLTKYSKDDVIRQYSSEEYPFNCDFYIKSEKLYLEYNGSQYHHGRPFDPNDPDDLTDLWRLKSKVKFYLTSKGKWKLNQYQSIIDTRTIRDVKKFNCARENNLNYVAIYSLKEFDEWWKGIQ